MRLVHNHGKALAGQFTDVLRDYREFLQRSDDDRLAALQRVLELTAFVVSSLVDRLRERVHLADQL
jgi:hypothetical protein